MAESKEDVWSQSLALGISNFESKICHWNFASEARIHPAAFPHAVAELCHPGAIPDTESEDTVPFNC